MSACSLPATVGPWFLTDDSCAQYCRKITDTEYEFVQLQWMDMLPREDSDYCVTNSTVNVGSMDLDEIETAICSFYDSVQAMVESYGKDMSVADYCQIIAECAFENEAGDNSISDILPEDKALDFLLNYIRTH